MKKTLNITQIHNSKVFFIDFSFKVWVLCIINLSHDIEHSAIQYTCMSMIQEAS